MDSPPQSTSTGEDNNDIASRLRPRGSSPFVSSAKLPLLRNKRKLIYDKNKENSEESPASPIKRTRKKLLGFEGKDESDSEAKNSDHTPQWLRLRLSKESSMEERFEKFREYSASLSVHYEAFRMNARNKKHLKAKDDIIEILKMRVAELQSDEDRGDNTSDDVESVQKLLHHFQQMQEENYRLVTELTQLETSEAMCKSKNRMLKAELCELKNEKDCVSDKLKSKLSNLENDLKRLKDENKRQDDKLKDFKDRFDNMKAQLQDKLEEQKRREKHLEEELTWKESKIVESQQQASEERFKKLELVEKLIEEKGRHSGVGEEHLLIVQEEIRSLKNSHMAMRQQIKDHAYTVRLLMETTNSKVQDAIQQTSRTNQDLVKRYACEIQLRKRYHNQLVELRGNIRVFCRIRPSHTNDQCLTFDPHDDGILRVNHRGRQQTFELDKVFKTTITQSQIFAEVSDLVRSVLDGFNVCIFAYGQTGSGKTYTMEGPCHDPGINQRALQFLYQQAQAMSWTYTMEASVLEVYNETIRDLLKPDPHAKLEVKLKADGGLNVPGLVKVPISSLDEANQVFQTGRENRAIEATNMNEHSSRSHCLLCVSVVGVNSVTGHKWTGQLNLVDLAGSERVDKSLAEGLRLKEAQNINKSLASLGDVINALKNKHNHIPYRNSKLTYLLQDSLGGDSKTLMILQASPEEVNVSETVCTLTFGQRVRSAELGAANRRMEDGYKGTPNSLRRAAGLDTPHASPTSSHSSRSTANVKSSHSAVKRKL